MRSTLCKFLLIPAFAAAAAFVNQPLQAQTVNVPFNFTVHGHYYPAGAYRVEEALNQSIVTLQFEDGGHGFMTILKPGDANDGDSRVVLRFVATGDGHALDSIQFGDLTSYRLAQHAVRESEERTAGGQ